MIGEHWQLGLVLGLLAVHAPIIYCVYHLRERSASPGVSDDPVDVGDGTVECPDCGAENEPGYRYCRVCVSELPATVGFERFGDGRLGRLTG